MHLKNYIFLAVFAILTAVLLSSRVVNAADKLDGTIKLTPAYLDVKLDKLGEVKKLQLFLTNNTTHQVTLQVFPIDFKQKEPEGVTTFIGQAGENYSYSLASFLSFQSDTVVLESGEKKAFDFQVENRKDVSPGGHYAAVVAKLVTENSPNGSTVLAPAVSSLIYLRKTGGEKYSMLLEDFDWPDHSIALSYSKFVDLTFQNEGNVHLIPYGLVQVKDQFGRLLYKGIINNSSARILPEARRTIEVPMVSVEKSWPISVNTFTISGHDSLGKVTYNVRKHFIYINPLVIILSVAMLYFFITWLKKRPK